MKAKHAVGRPFSRIELSLALRDPDLFFVHRLLLMIARISQAAMVSAVTILLCMSQMVLSLQGRVLGIDNQFLPKIVETAISLSSGCDLDVKKNGERIKQEVGREEDR